MVLASSYGISLEIGFVAGILIGCTGMGGVVMVPMLIMLPDVSVYAAIGACMASYIVSPLVVYTYLRHTRPVTHDQRAHTKKLLPHI
jgi:uncharacterized membrane protein YfcA